MGLDEPSGLGRGVDLAIRRQRLGSTGGSSNSSSPGNARPRLEGMPRPVEGSVPKPFEGGKRLRCWDCDDITREKIHRGEACPQTHSPANGLC